MRTGPYTAVRRRGKQRSNDLREAHASCTTRHPHHSRYEPAGLGRQAALDRWSGREAEALGTSRSRGMATALFALLKTLNQAEISATRRAHSASVTH